MSDQEQELSGIVDALRAQRNAALDAVAQLNGQLATLSRKLEEVNTKLAEKTEELANANAPAGPQTQKMRS